MPLHDIQLKSQVTLRKWQVTASNQWMKNGGQGTVKVVTGAGKSIMALNVMSKMQEETPNLKVALIVPTKPLQNQWVDNLVDFTTIPRREIGLLGGGHDDTFEDKRVLVITMHTAANRLAGMVKNGKLKNNLMLLVDECHRLGAPKMKNILEVPRRYTLGLSATPERDEGAIESVYNDSFLGKQIGKLVYTMTFDQAVKWNILPKFNVVHMGLNFNPDEAKEYDSLSDQIRHAWFGIKALENKKEDASQIRGIMQLLSWKRKRFIYGCERRVDASVKLVVNTLKEKPDAHVMLFHENIKDATRIHDRLKNYEVASVLVHSKVSVEERTQALEAFKNGTIPVIISVKTLIEGVDAPKADVGIIVSSSASIRQRIQTIGRILRKDGDKEALVYVLYMSKSADEGIYHKVDWEKFMGKGINTFYTWAVENGDQPVKFIMKNS